MTLGPPWLAEFATVLVAAVLASGAHEATHYVVARALGHEARFSVREWAVYHRGPGDRLTWRDIAIAAAPVIVGLPVGVVLLARWPVPFWAGFAWAVYTLLGALTNDFQFRAGTPA